MTKETILKCKGCKFKWVAHPTTVYDACPSCDSLDWVLKPIAYKMKDGTLVGTIEYDRQGELVYFPELNFPLSFKNLYDLAKVIAEHD